MSFSVKQHILHLLLVVLAVQGQPLQNEAHKSVSERKTLSFSLLPYTLYFLFPAGYSRNKRSQRSQWPIPVACDPEEACHGPN